MFSRRIIPHYGGSKILEKNTWKFFFGKSSHRYLSPSFDGERGGIWGANGEGGSLYPFGDQIALYRFTDQI